MKKYLLIAAACMMAGSAAAQITEMDGVPVVLNAYGNKISPDGNLIVGQNPNGDTFTYNRLTNALHDYSDGYFGSGNVVSNTGITVGQGYSNSAYTFIAATMSDGKITPVPTLTKYGWGILHGINADATRACGVVTNPNMIGDVMDPSFNSFMYVPFYCDIDADGTFSEPHWLPVAPKDFFGGVPQECSAVWISDDGKTIAGQVVSNNGFYRYPIVYKQDDSGEWSYSLPSEKLFNTKGYEMPVYPWFDDEPVSPTDFMSSEEDIESFNEALENWMESGYEEDADPYRNLDIWMTPEQIAEYEAALKKYQEALDQFDRDYTEYLMKIEEIVNCSVFFLQNAMALNSEGTILASSHNIPLFYSGYMPVENFQPYIFYLDNGTYKVAGTEEDRLITNQVLPDGTLVCCTPPYGASSPDATPVHSSVLLPGADTFIPVEDFIAKWNPAKAEWMQKNLYKTAIIGLNEAGGYVTKDLMVSGIVAFNNDLTVMSSGIDGYGVADDPLFTGEFNCYFTYIFEGMESGVKEISSEMQDGIYHVFNLQGMKVLETKDAGQIDLLPKGIYIVNGKKIAL